VQSDSPLPDASSFCVFSLIFAVVSDRFALLRMAERRWPRGPRVAEREAPGIEGVT
jgi:hypothetical protein